LLALTLFFHRAELSHGTRHLSLILATTLGFAVLARLAHGVSNSGGLAGAVVAFILALRDIKMFFLLLIVFCVTLAATRLGGLRKQQLELAESAGGRSASQVMAHLGVAALLLTLPSFPSACVLALAALAELSADTTSSEVGTALAGKTVLITSLKSVPAGTDGGISLSGTAAGVLAAIIIGACAHAFDLIQWAGVIVIACAGTAGMLVDSILGATAERRGDLNNDFVNLLSTASAALLMWILT